jgi:fibronectin-binding autotransporter adhesin
MKQKPSISIVGIFACSLALSLGSLSAQTFVYLDTTVGGIGNGSSNITANTTWNTALLNWDVGSGLPRVAWDNTTNASATAQLLVDGGNYTINVASNISVGSLNLTQEAAINRTLRLYVDLNRTLTINGNDGPGAIYATANTTVLGGGGTILLGDSQTWRSFGTPTLVIGTSLSQGLTIDTGFHTLTLAGNVSQTNTSANNYSVIDGSGSLIIGGTGLGAPAVTLNGLNAYTGSTTLGSGTLTINTAIGNGGTPGALGKSSSDASNLVFDGGILRDNWGNNSTDRDFTVTEKGATIRSDASALGVGLVMTGTAVMSGTGDRTITLRGNNTPSISSNTIVGNFADPVSGTTSLVKTDGNRWILTGSNTYSGTTSINSGILVVGNGGTEGTLGSGAVTITGATTTLTFNRSDEYLLANDISGTGRLRQEGDGTLILVGDNTHTGTTVVAAGTLLVSGSLGNTAVTVESGAAFGGTGSLGGSIHFAAGSLLHVVDLDTPFEVSGAISFFNGFGVANLQFDNLNNLNEGTYTLLEGDIADFTMLANTSPQTAFDLGNGKSAYFAEGSLQLIVIPEPAPIALLTVVFATALRMRTRRTFP